MQRFRNSPVENQDFVYGVFPLSPQRFHTFHSHSSMQKTVTRSAILELIPTPLQAALDALLHERGTALFLVGGTVRDLLLGRRPKDLDLCLPSQATRFARELARRFGGTCVCLDAEEDVARVVLPDGFALDFAAFREKTVAIEEDLPLRDFTINALALDLGAVLTGREPLLLDPCGGAADIKSRLIRLTHDHAFVVDPLRMVRAYRLAATLDCSLDATTRQAVRCDFRLIVRSAGERIALELDAIMASSAAHEVFQQMRADDLLFALIPELALGKDVTQPKDFHHLDVLDHNLESLKQAEWLAARPEALFPDCAAPLCAWLAVPENLILLKWAALLHDVGKPAMRREGPDGRISFHQHDQTGAQLVRELALRLRWSTRRTERVCRLVTLHMRPYHLLGVPELTLRACIRVVQAADEDLPGLALVNMADTLAGKGELRPPDLEGQVARLATRLFQVQAERVTPVRSAPPLLTGKDLIALGLSPGPLFKKILAAVELARMEGGIATQQEALALAKNVAAQAKSD